MMRRTIRNLNEEVRKKHVRDMQALVGQAGIWPLNAPGMPPPGPDFLRVAMAMGDDTEYVPGTKKKEGKYTPGDRLRELYRKALRTPGFTLPIDIRKGAQPEPVVFIPGHIWGQHAAEWLTYQAKQLLQVRQEQFEHAKAQLERAEARFHEKIGPEIEVWRAEAGLARRLESIIIAENLLRDRQRTLKRIINAPGADVDSSVVLVLSSKPDLVRYNFDPAELLAQSLDQRAELLEQELRLAQAASTIDFERNGALPLATLDYVYRIDGSGDRLGRAFSSAAEIESQGWAVGLNLEVPLGNEAAQSRVHRAILTRLQRLATREARRQEVKQEVLSALDNLDLTWQRIVAARQNVIVEERNYRGEQGQYQLGLRNSTEVLDAETRLADAKASFINAIVDYQVAQVDLAFATGMLLGAAKVSW